MSTRTSFRSRWCALRRPGRLVLSALSCLLFASLGGCAALAPTWEDTASTMRSTARETRDYINPAPHVDVNRYKWDNPNQEKLALLFSPVDAKVMALTRYVTSIDFRPTEQWVDALLLRFPWVDGVIVADENGQILNRKPPVPLKRFSEPLVFESIWRETLVKTVVDYTAFGPELYFGMPNFEGSDFKGLHVVSFDPRVLFSFCPNPEELIIVDPRAQKFWVAGETAPTGAAELTSLPWLEMMKKQIQGTVKVGDKQFTWLARFIGRDLFIYATESANPAFEDKGFSFPLFGGNS
jgi:hypothetical protein